MKTFIITLFSGLLLNTSAYSNENMNKEITNQFKDKIKKITVIEGNLEVQFHLHAAVYKLSKENPKFSELKSFLEGHLEKKDKIKVTSSIPSLEIKELAE